MKTLIWLLQGRNYDCCEIYGEDTATARRDAVKALNEKDLLISVETDDVGDILGCLILKGNLS